MTISDYFKEWMSVIDRQETVKIMNWLRTVNHNTLCPALPDVFRAFRLCSYRGCRVICVGMDPYPDRFMGKPRATGILFGNRSDVPEDKLSPSLDVVKESVINFEIPHNIINFDQTLETWAEQGMLMLNSALTCELNRTGSHVNIWRPFISKFLRNMSDTVTGIVYILFGRQAQTLKPYINSRFNDIIETEHPAYYARINEKMPYSIFKDMNDILYGRYGEKITLFNEI